MRKDSLNDLIAGLEVAVAACSPPHASLYTGQAYKLYDQYPDNVALSRIARLLERLDHEPDLAFVEKALEIAYELGPDALSIHSVPIHPG